MAKAQKGGGRHVRVDWSKAEEEPVQAVNVFAAQANPQYHLLNLGFLAPPVTIDQGDVQGAGELSIAARVVARILLTPEDMRQLVKILSDNIASREKLLKSEREQ
jgi:hypothetical protein